VALVLDSGRPVRDLAYELGVNHKTLRNWVSKGKQERAGTGGATPEVLSSDEGAELTRLRRQVARLQLERRWPTTCAPSWSSTPSAWRTTLDVRPVTSSSTVRTAERRHYTSFEFDRTLRSCGVLASMGSVADCFDCALAETFFTTVKTEVVYTRAWPTRLLAGAEKHRGRGVHDAAEYPAGTRIWPRRVH
jgi:hypothetical protein